MKKIQIGDRITFKAATRYSCEKVTRVVTGFWFANGFPTVRYNGYRDFVVRPNEIKKVKRK